MPKLSARAKLSTPFGDRAEDQRRKGELRSPERDLGSGHVLLAGNALEKLETWALAGLDLPSRWNWSDVRASVDGKEQYLEPLTSKLGVADGPGGGRKALGERAARRIPAIRQKCREDFDDLAQRLGDVF